MNTKGVDIVGAKAAYAGLIGISDSGLANPSKDWSKQIGKFAVDDAAAGVLSDIELARSSGVHVVGHSSYTATISRASASKVEISACIDNSGQDIVDQYGRSVKAGDGARYRQSATIAREQNGRWYVTSIDASSGQTC